MQITAVVDREDVAADLESVNSDSILRAIEGNDYLIQSARLSDVIQVVLDNLAFSIDREDAELADVIQFPEVR